MTEPRNINFERVNSNGYNGLTLKGPHLPRSQLIEKLLRSIERNLFTIISAPSATGKTSAVCIFSWMPKTHKTVYVPLLPDTSAFESLKRVGIDLLEDKWMDCNDNDYTVVILDDAQLRYTEGNFWKTLIKDLPVAYPKRILKVRFILTSNEIGLPSVLHSYSNLLEHMVRECAGHIGALRISVDYLAAQLKIVSSTPSEQTVLDWFFSKNLLLRMERCFGGLDVLEQNTPSKDVDTVFIGLLAGQVCSCVRKLPPEILHIQKCGVLSSEPSCVEREGFVGYPS